MDDARFDKQRRNVMVTSCLLIAAWYVKADFTKFSFVGLTADAPQKIGILWALLIAYFMWRLYQVSGKEQTDDQQAMFMEIFKHRLSEVARREVIKEKNEEIKNVVRPSWKFVSLVVVLVEGSVSYSDYKFSADFYVNCKWETPEGGDSHESSKRKKSYVVGQPEHEGAIKWAKMVAMFKKKTFTEYRLPYLLGSIGVLIGVFGF